MATFTTDATKKGVQSSTKPLEALPFVSGLQENRPRIRKGRHRIPPPQSPPRLVVPRSQSLPDRSAVHAMPVRKLTDRQAPTRAMNLGIQLYT